MYEMQGPHCGPTKPPACRLLGRHAIRLASTCQRTRAMSSCLVFALRRDPHRSASGVASEAPPESPPKRPAEGRTCTISGCPALALPLDSSPENPPESPPKCL
jgi:hypothetical protein